MPFTHVDKFTNVIRQSQNTNKCISDTNAKKKIQPIYFFLHSFELTNNYFSYSHKK